MSQTSQQSRNSPTHTMSITQPNRADGFRVVANQVPHNDYGLPVLIYRADLVPEDVMQRNPNEQAKILQIAAIELNALEGFPAFHDGRAFWSQMEHEPDDAYQLFKEYLGQAETIGIRRVEALTGNIMLKKETISEFYSFYYWSARSKAFDLFRVAAHQKLREKRVMSINDKQFLETEGMLNKVRSYFEKTNDDGQPQWLEELNPKVAMEMYEKLTRIQRTALGLSAHGHNQKDDAPPPNADVETLLKAIVRKSEDPDAIKKLEQNHDLDAIMEDPELVAAAQALIVQIDVEHGSELEE